MAFDEVAQARLPGHDLASLRDDRLLWGLLAAVAACLLLGAVLMALWASWFALVLVTVLVIVVAASIVTGIRRASQQDLLLWALAIAMGRGVPLTSALPALPALPRRPA